MEITLKDMLNELTCVETECKDCKFSKDGFDCGKIQSGLYKIVGCGICSEIPDDIKEQIIVTCNDKYNVLSVRIPDWIDIKYLNLTEAETEIDDTEIDDIETDDDNGMEYNKRVLFNKMVNDSDYFKMGTANDFVEYMNEPVLIFDDDMNSEWIIYTYMSYDEREE